MSLGRRMGEGQLGPTSSLQEDILEIQHNHAYISSAKAKSNGYSLMQGELGNVVLRLAVSMLY